jgi:hypothetical protein
MVSHPFDPGYGSEPFRSLVTHYPGEDVYPTDAFRTEWGPVFHRGRLDGSARVLVIGQDPAAHEAIARRILTGAAGQRLQGFLARLGMTRSYVCVNTFLYSMYGDSGDKYVATDGVVAYRNAWPTALTEASDIQAVVTLGTLAGEAYDASPLASTDLHVRAAMLHPTYPESASRSGQTTKAAAMARLCASWNAALDTLSGAVTQDVATGPSHYGTALTDADVVDIPERDLPPGLPAWMRRAADWARRVGDTPAAKRATITVTVPAGALPSEPT